jgi:phosphoribosylpyrophosphate synthetase
MEMLIMAYACRTSSARKIVGVIPYLPYCKQSKMRKRGCIVSKLLAHLMVKAGWCPNVQCHWSVSGVLCF